MHETIESGHAHALQRASHVKIEQSAPIAANEREENGEHGESHDDDDSGATPAGNGPARRKDLPHRKPAGRRFLEQAGCSPGGTGTSQHGRARCQSGTREQALAPNGIIATPDLPRKVGNLGRKWGDPVDIGARIAGLAM